MTLPGFGEINPLQACGILVFAACNTFNETCLHFKTADLYRQSFPSPCMVCTTSIYIHSAATQDQVSGPHTACHTL